MNKIIDIEYIYIKDKKYNNAMYIYIYSLLFLIILLFFIFIKNKFYQ